ncbi:VOC family protein [Serinibacter salmoneus]|uniref:Methylmalonyl-CoA epimerase n=1 Tax=Serinibacter salmoneus TaxID=556530 RepID=A0A2A9D5W4_9MICO|nr:VOC family protein [Serinibacter salmoneus]PFG21230.1 methylmalonyl-CoA epimerase [Serinibacter salmoneus]
MGVRSAEHIGLVVADLDRAVAFFEAVGFDVGERMRVGGAWADRVNGLEGTDVEMAFATAPDGSGAIEITRFVHPASPPVAGGEAANHPGLRHLAYRVDDLDGTLARAREAGYDLVGAVEAFDPWRLCYLRGPEGLILELAERAEDPHAGAEHTEE